MNNHPDDFMVDADDTLSDDSLFFERPAHGRTHSSDLEDQLMSDAGQLDEPDVVSLTLAQFVSTAKDFLDGNAMDDFAKFVLTGIHAGTQYQVDPIKDTLRDNHGIQALRDYDSVLGLHKDICITTHLTVYPVSKFEDTLRRNIHIKYSFTNNTGRYVDIPVHKIPNLCIAKWGTHNMIRVLLPGLYNDERRTPFLSQEELAAFYEKGLRPAVEKLVGVAAAEWPPTYSAEMFRARGKNGTLSFQTKTVAEWYVGSLGDEIRGALSANNVPWGDGLLFLHQIRGVKSSNGHTPSTLAAYTALDELFAANQIPADAYANGQWWIDVGLEVSSRQKQCLAWRTDSHFHVVKHVLEIRDQVAQRITRPGSSKYIRDMTSHLTAVSGCRISPGVRAQGPHNAVYLQMYTTDKSITYRPDGAHFGKFLKGQDILQGKADDFCHDLYELYRQASEVNYALARIEVRVPLQDCTDVLVDVDTHILSNGLVRFDPVVWWSLRAYRVLAFKYILQQQARGDAALRSTNSALLLTAAAPWFLNGIHSAPDNGPCSRDLMGKILPIVNRVDADVDTLAYPSSTRAHGPQLPVAEEEEEEEEEENAEDGRTYADHAQEDNLSVASDFSDAPDAVPNPRHAHQSTRPETLPFNPYGIVFLRPIRIGEGIVVPRFRDHSTPMITYKTFHYIFGVHRDDVDGEFFKAQLVIPSNPRRVANKRRRTVLRARDEQEAPKIFNLSGRGYRLPSPARDEGSDYEEFRNEVEDEDGDIDKKLTELWRQFLLDLTNKAPNRRHATESSYCALDPNQRVAVNDATYRNMRLRDYFGDCQFKTATKQEWDAAFDKFWPIFPLLTGKPQNLPSMTYYINWGLLVNRLHSQEAEETITEMRRDLRKRFYTMGWIPNIQSDRVWYTRLDRRFKRFPEANPREAAPRILIRWDLDPII